jgi:hypothetical protein
MALEYNVVRLNAERARQSTPPIPGRPCAAGPLRRRTLLHAGAPFEEVYRKRRG